MKFGIKVCILFFDSAILIFMVRKFFFVITYVNFYAFCRGLGRVNMTCGTILEWWLLGPHFFLPWPPRPPSCFWVNCNNMQKKGRGHDKKWIFKNVPRNSAKNLLLQMKAEVFRRKVVKNHVRKVAQNVVLITHRHRASRKKPKMLWSRYNKNQKSQK